MEAEPIELQIEDLAHGGDGLGHHDGRVVFVPGGLPGDRVRGLLPAGAKDRRFSRLERMQVVEPSPHRRPATCAHRPHCGGCPWHELDGEVAARAKLQTVLESLRRIAGLDIAGLPALLDSAAQQGPEGLLRRPSPTLGYRMRARLAIRRSGDRTHAGYRAAASHRIIDVAACPLLDAGLAEPTQRALTLARERGWPAGTLQVAAGVQPRQASAVLTLSQPIDHAAELAAELRSAGFAGAELRLRRSGRAEAELLARDGEIELAGLVASGSDGGPYGHDPQCFTQPSEPGNLDLLDAVRAAAGSVAGQRVVELHAGAGNLSLALALDGAEVLAVEQVEGSLAWLQKNASQAGVEKTLSALQADVEQLDSWLPELANGPDLLLLDPPRTGFRMLAQVAQQLQPRQLVYVSCDPATLARDIKPLAELGYQAMGAQVLDLMPGSWHIETVLKFARTKA